MANIYRTEEAIDKFIVITGYASVDTYADFSPLNYNERDQFPIGSIAEVQVIESGRTVIENSSDPCLCVCYFQYREATPGEKFMCILNGGFIRGDEIEKLEKSVREEALVKGAITH